MTADEWNETCPVGTPVLAWPGAREVEPMVTRTRTPAWTLGCGDPVVSVEGWAGGIYLTHIEVVPGLCRAVSEHGDVCVNPEDHRGLCRSGVGRKHVSSPGQAGKPWFWYRDAAASTPGGDLMPMSDVRSVVFDPAVPDDVVERLIDRLAARRAGRTPDVVPEDDKPWLARHVVDAPEGDPR
ncbi:hypothetical protein ACFQVD_26705 [Streptosporangium amethystogenes subsp. fukuiense]|uniref:Uncharacterized protein n=1 Tax=Streptosporangium amethystogenes subsp. fukuiense TaxID=698418 RepID=A0ABW2T6D1_9ACTN